jgi:hypothetical protein
MGRESKNTRCALTVATAAIAALPSCTTLPEKPVVSRQFSGSYERLATCAYERLGREEGQAGLRFTELRAVNAITINRDAQGPIPLYEARFTRAGDNLTQVEVKAHPTVWGATLHADGMMPHVEACASGSR